MGTWSCNSGDGLAWSESGGPARPRPVARTPRARPCARSARGAAGPDRRPDDPAGRWGPVSQPGLRLAGEDGHHVLQELHGLVLRTLERVASHDGAEAAAVPDLLDL